LNDVKSASQVPPEVVFHRYFQTSPRRKGMEHIKGKQDLSRLSAMLESFLTDVQVALNQSLAQSRAAMAELGRPLVVHLDYLESSMENAHAFQSEGYQFIGITIPLVERLLKASSALVAAEKVITLLRLDGAREKRENATGGVFGIMFLFVAAHEFGHQLLGHASEFRPEHWNDVEDAGTGGSLELQAEENLADSYAVFLALGSLLDGLYGQQVLQMLGHGATPHPDDDEILMSVLLLCAFSFFSAKSHEALDALSLYNLSHPPAFARVNGIIQTTRVWCQRYRRSLDAWMTQDRLEEIMHAEENSRPGSEGAWERQIEFFMSPDGAQYFERLGEQIARMPAPTVPPSVA
jgi:hypothetical protein